MNQYVYASLRFHCGVLDNLDIYTDRQAAIDAVKEYITENDILTAEINNSEDLYVIESVGMAEYNFQVVKQSLL